MLEQCLSRIQQFLLHYKPREPFIPHEYIKTTIKTNRRRLMHINKQQNKEESRDMNSIGFWSIHVRNLFNIPNSSKLSFLSEISQKKHNFSFKYSKLVILGSFQSLILITISQIKLKLNSCVQFAIGQRWYKNNNFRYQFIRVKSFLINV